MLCEASEQCQERLCDLLEQQDITHKHKQRSCYSSRCELFLFAQFTQNPLPFQLWGQTLERARFSEQRQKRESVSSLKKQRGISFRQEILFFSLQIPAGRPSGRKKRRAQCSMFSGLPTPTVQLFLKQEAFRQSCSGFLHSAHFPSGIIIVPIFPSCSPFHWLISRAVATPCPALLFTSRGNWYSYLHPYSVWTWAFSLRRLKASELNRTFFIWSRYEYPLRAAEVRLLQCRDCM